MEEQEKYYVCEYDGYLLIFQEAPKGFKVLKQGTHWECEDFIDNELDC